MIFASPNNKATKAGNGNDCGDEVAQPTPFSRHMESLRRNEDVTAANHRHEQSRNQRNEVAVWITVSGER